MALQSNVRILIFWAIWPKPMDLDSNPITKLSSVWLIRPNPKNLVNSTTWDRWITYMQLFQQTHNNDDYFKPI